VRLDFLGFGVLGGLQQCQGLQYKVAAQAMKVPGRKSELQQMSDSQPVTLPDPPKAINTCLGYGVKGLLVVQWAMQC
jgi:hypothetical protein